MSYQTNSISIKPCRGRNIVFFWWWQQQTFFSISFLTQAPPYIYWLLNLSGNDIEISLKYIDLTHWFWSHWFTFNPSPLGNSHTSISDQNRSNSARVKPGMLQLCGMYLSAGLCSKRTSSYDLFSDHVGRQNNFELFGWPHLKAGWKVSGYTELRDVINVQIWGWYVIRHSLQEGFHSVALGSKHKKLEAQLRKEGT